MAIRFACPHCGTAYNLDDSFSGQTVRCRQCLKAFAIGPKSIPPSAPRSAAAPRPPANPRPSMVVWPERRPAEPSVERPTRSRVTREDEDEPIRPASAPLPMALLAGGAAFLLVLLVAGGVTAWVLLRPQPAATANAPAPIPQPADGATPPREPDPAPQTTPVTVPSAPSVDPRGSAVAAAPSADSGPLAGQPVLQMPTLEPPPAGAQPAERRTPADASPQPLLGDSGGGIPARTLDELKAATVFVRVEAGPISASGSGFVIKTEGDAAYVVTNDHVVSPEVETVLRNGRRVRRTLRPETISISAVFRSGTRNERAFRAAVVATDPERDLAVLHVRGAGELRPIDPDRTPALRETMPVFILGFPFGSALATSRDNPAITIGRGSISSVRENSKGDAAVVQIDGAINPGNSGGPVVDAEGRLVGVAVATIKGSGIGLAIPPLDLQKMLLGRVGATGTAPRRIDSGATQVDVEVHLIDPLQRVQAVGVVYAQTGGAAPRGADGRWSALPGGQQVALTVSGQKATGSFRVPVGDSSGASYQFQTYYTNGAGETVYTQPTPLRLDRG